MNLDGHIFDDSPISVEFDLDGKLPVSNTATGCRLRVPEKND
jgi:hypothetical protein